jgi:hypothetical protein
MPNRKTSSVRWAFGFQWVMVKTLGSVVGLMVGFVGLLVHGTLFGVIVGTAVGVMQWLVLREHISRAGSWAAACTTAGVITGPVLIWLLRHPRSEAQIVAGDAHRSPGRD